MIDEYSYGIINYKMDLQIGIENVYKSLTKMNEAITVYMQMSLKCYHDES